MSTRDQLTDKLSDLMTFVAGLDLDDADAARDALAREFPADSAALVEIGALLRAGIEAGELCDRENGGVKFSRLKKAASDDELSIDLVHMAAAGPGHKHPNGEVDLCFAVSGEPTFDGRAPGWTVYPKGSWHVPTVAGGVMDIIYFLPGGAIEFGPRE
jgi:hypothetical protein